MKAAESSVADFYHKTGWAVADGHTEDASRWEDLRPSSADYVSRCRLRVRDHIEGSNRVMDMASGPIQYDEYLTYSAGFEERHCIDLSAQALAGAEARIGKHGVFWQGSFFEYEAPDDFFDCAISLHTIYHMDADQQEEAVRKLLRLTSGPVIIIYSNPDALLSRMKRLFGRRAAAGDLYFHAHPLSWWNRFRNVANVEILPWRTFGGAEMRAVVPGGRIGSAFLALLFRLEAAWPRFFVRNGRFPMVVLRKR